MSDGRLDAIREEAERRGAYRASDGSTVHRLPAWSDVWLLLDEEKRLREALRSEVRKRFAYADGKQPDDAWLDEYIAKTYPAVAAEEER